MIDAINFEIRDATFFAHSFLTRFDVIAVDLNVNSGRHRIVCPISVYKIHNVLIEKDLTATKAADKAKRIY